jgi:hypothetical protein
LIIIIRKTSGVKLGKCFYCGNEILENEGTIYPLDKPYVNLKMHRICAKAVDLNFLQENYQRILDYVGENSSKTKTKRK